MTDDAEADEALLFEERGGRRRAITRAPLELPQSDDGWQLVQTFTLGIQHVMPIDMDPEPVIRAIAADGYYVWETEALPQPNSTGQ